MSDDSAIKVTGSCSIGGEEVGLTGVKATVAVNSWPLFNVETALYATDEADSKLVTVADLKEKLGGWQKKINGDGLAGEFSLRAGGSVVQAAGYVASVGLDVLVGRCRTSAVILPEYTALDTLNLGLYIPCLALNDAAGSTIYEEARKNLGGGITLTGYTRELVKLVVGKFNADEYKKRGGKKAAEVAEAVHALNGKVVGYFYEILSNSEDIDDVYDIKGLLSGGRSNVEVLGAAIVNCLTRSNGSFLGTMCSYANLFRLFYRPGMNDVGGFLPKASMVAGGESGAESVKSPAVAISGNARATSQFPLGTVYTVTDFSFTDVDGKGGNRTGGYTAPDIGGPARTMRIAPPVWLTARNLASVNVHSEGRSAQSQASSPPDMAEGQTAGGGQATGGASDSDAIAALLEKWCEEEYNDQKWGNYTVALTVPGVELAWGARRGTGVGTGFARASQCIAAMGSGGRGTCRTMITFSHFDYGA